MRTPATSAFESISVLERSATPLTGTPITKDAAKHGRSIAHLIERRHFPMPFVFPTEIGGIQFEWKGDGRELNLEVLPEGERFSFLKIVDGEPAQEGEITADFEREVSCLLDWLVTAAQAL
jgi:hypothetical protein